MSGVSIRLDGRDKTVARLGAMARQAQHPRGLYHNIGARLVASTIRRFEFGSAPDGSKWPISIRARKTGGKTLKDTGSLRNTLKHNANDSSVEVGTNVLYAAAHQFGVTIRPKTKAALRFKIGKQWLMRKSVTLPARPFLGIDEDDRVEIIRVADQWLKGEARAG